VERAESQGAGNEDERATECSVLARIAVQVSMCVTTNSVFTDDVPCNGIQIPFPLFFEVAFSLVFHVAAPSHAGQRNKGLFPYYVTRWWWGEVSLVRFNGEEGVVRTFAT